MSETRRCQNCQNELVKTAKLCPQCGIPCQPERDNQRKWMGIDFKLFVILLTFFCAAMVLWLPR
ncbi:hypothetical protein [Litoribacillus peritrichatus]|uniref:hypothetical protein n=1 Tax=Litoribacillus peritrichatus TaxID=718191 RepID=UPI0031DE84DC